MDMPSDKKDMLLDFYSEDTQEKLRNPEIIFQNKLYTMSGPFNTRSDEEKAETINEIRVYLDSFDIDYEEAARLFRQEGKERGFKYKTIGQRLWRLKQIYSN